MRTHQFLAMCVLAAVGCAPADNGNNRKTEEDSADTAARSPFVADMEALPPQITNQFGMTFRLVTIDTTRPDHKDSFPARSYYLQETDLTGEQHSAFREAAFGDGTFESIDWYFNGGFPSEWSEVIRYASSLSNFDPQYDYGLPSRSQWSFACMNGYEQQCNEDQPNTLGFVGMLDGDFDVIDEFHVQNGYKFGVLMGRWKNNWGEHNGKPKPDCPCEHWAACNRDADDSLNELIVARLILLPEGTARSKNK